MESKAAVKSGVDAHSGPQLLKSLSDRSTNDSGYNSDVFTSPEFSRGSWNLGVVPADTLVKGCLMFDGPATRTRLASTPCEGSNVKKIPASTFPSPDLGAIRKSCLSNDSAIDSIETDASELEITSRKDTNNSLNVMRGHQDSRLLKATSKIKPFEVPLARHFTRAKKPLNVFLKILQEADYLLYDVLKHLSAQDLIRVSHVNRQLRTFILKHKNLSLTIFKRRKECEHIGKENVKLKRLDGAGTSYGKLSPRKHLGDIQNLSTCDRKAPVTMHCPPRPLFDRFIEEGKKLPEGEVLQKCVKCRAPAKVFKSAFRAVCSSETCGHDYCTRCCLPSHRKAQDCSVLKSRSRSGASLFSKKSKKNLRRL